MGYVRVAPEQSIDLAPSGLTYAVPRSLAPLRPGNRVTVPLGRGNRSVAGFVIEAMAEPDLDPTLIKPVLQCDPGNPPLTDDLIVLARWMAGYYCCPLGMVVAAMIPAAVKRRTGTVAMRRVVPAAEPPEGTLTALQRRIMETTAEGQAQGVTSWEMRELADKAGARTVGAVRRLVEKGWLCLQEETVVRARHDALDEVGSPAPHVAIEPSRDQNEVISAVVGDLPQGFSVHLLHGVTGSGKTEVYLQIMARIVDGDPEASAVMLVPEIALTPQTVRRIVERFDAVAVLHSGLTAAQRHEQWQRIRSGRARVVVGARSAVFAPLPKPALIVVDEEHDTSYKQDQLPRYHARDVAIKRGQLLGIPVILGSATPSLESYHNAKTAPPERRYRLHNLPHRVAGRSLPSVEIVDMNEQRRRRHSATGSRAIHLLSLELESAMTSVLADRGQLLLLLNRRGYASHVGCPDPQCGWQLQCEFCDVALVYHKQAALPVGGFVRCHHCGSEQLLPAQCPECRAHRIVKFGPGTQRVEEELAKKFPAARALRMDADTMRRGRDYIDTLARFGRGEADILLGTQMIAKGLDFPNVQLVGVISADTALHLPDFRAAERTFQMVAQVAGRAGRGEKAGHVIVQTSSPEDVAIGLAARHDYAGFADAELTLRAQVGLPPSARMARIVVRHRDATRCAAEAGELATALEAMNQRLGLSVVVRGPDPCPIRRIADHHRQQIEIIAAPPGAGGRLQRLMTALRNAGVLRADARTAVDVDPVALM